MQYSKFSQKMQPLENKSMERNIDVLRNRWSYKFRKLHRKTPVLEFPFRKVAGLWACYFIQTGSSRLQMFFKIGVLNNFANFTGKHLFWSLFLINFLTTFIKGTPAQVFSYEVWKNFKNNFSTDHLQWLLVSKETPTQVFGCEICKCF